MQLISQMKFLSFNLVIKSNSHTSWSTFKAFVVLNYITITIYKTGKSFLKDAIIAFEIKSTIFKGFININRFFYIQVYNPLTP